MNEKIYLPGLNGLRAIAALSVLLGHVTSTTFVNSTFGLPVVALGEHGVTLFFVISGFLITYLLLKEVAATNNIAIGKFYMRRILRIWPLYYLFIALCLIVAIFVNDIKNIFSINACWYLFFTANIALLLNETVRIIIHYWSIGVEEQFYLFWPWLVKLKRNNILRATIILIIIFFVVKSGLWIFAGNKYILYRFMNISRFHCMLIGSTGAMIYSEGNSRIINFFINPIIQITVWIFFVLIFTGALNLPAPIISEVFSVLSLLIILGQITNTKKHINLENNVLDFVGKISYGIYVIHPIVIVIFAFIFRSLDLPIIIKFPIVFLSIISSTILLAYLSYRFYEKPFLKLKSAYTVVESVNAKNNS